MKRSAFSIFRPLVVAMLALAVFASPVMSAEASARACAAAHDRAAAAVEKKCCAAKHAEHRSEKQQQKKSDQGDKDCGSCADVCCRTVTATEAHHATIIGETLALSVEIAPVVARELVSHNLIFHPPRA